MSVLNEDTRALLCLIERNEALYDDCYRITAQVLEADAPRTEGAGGVDSIAVAARSDLRAALEG